MVPLQIDVARQILARNVQPELESLYRTVVVAPPVACPTLALEYAPRSPLPLRFPVPVPVFPAVPSPPPPHPLSLPPLLSPSLLSLLSLSLLSPLSLSLLSPLSFPPPPPPLPPPLPPVVLLSSVLWHHQPGRLPCKSFPHNLILTCLGPLRLLPTSLRLSNWARPLLLLARWLFVLAAPRATPVRGPRGLAVLNWSVRSIHSSR